MTPEQALNKLRRLRDWNKMTDVKRKALDVAIKAVESHEVMKKCTLVDNHKTFFFSDGEGGDKSGITEISVYCCPSCGESVRVAEICMKRPFPKYCSNCGQKLKAREE